MRVQIEEKEFESQFLVEFERTHHTFNYGYAIGQTMEGHKGYEGIFYTNRHIIFHRIGLKKRRLGRLMIDIDGFEDVRANLFIQFKRSQKYIGKRSKPFRHWNQSYYEFRIEKAQQKILSDFSDKNKSTLAVIYAAPVFHLRQELKTHKRANTIIENSNLVRVSKLNNHARYTFVSPKNGKAFSEPENIDSETMEKIISSLSDSKADKLSFESNITNLGSIIDEVLRENNLFDYFEEISKDRFKELIKSSNDSEMSELSALLSGLSKILTFQEITNTRWITL